MNTPTPDSGPDYQMTGPIDDMGGTPSSHRVRRFLGFLLKYWWIPLVTVIIGFGAGAAYVYFKAPTFVSRSSMWETLKLSLPEGAMFTEDMQNVLGTESELLQSTTLREQALARMRLMTNTVEIPLGEDGQPLPVTIHVSGSAKSSVFVIEATSSNPAFTENYLNALMGAYLDYKKNVRQIISGDTLASISEQMQRWERDLKVEQDALAAFQETNNISTLQEEGQIAGDYLAKLKTQLSDLQLEDQVLDVTADETNESAVDELNTNANLPKVAAMTGSNSTAKVVAKQSLTPAEIELKRQQEIVNDYYRNQQAESNRVAQLHLEEEHQKEQQHFKEEHRINQLQIQNVQAAISQWEAKVAVANRLIAEANRLKLNVDRVQSVYDRLALLVENVDISRNIDQDSLAILEPASPVKRSYSSEESGMVLASVGGLAAGLGLVFLIMVRDDRFTSVTEVNTALGDAVIGMLPEVGGKGNGDLPLLELNDPRHAYAESYRSLRSALLFLPTEGERPKILLITSAMPNAGKSTIAANLARTMALSGSRVLLVDGDLRKGHLHQRLNLPNEPGFSELLHQTCEPEKVIQTDPLSNFDFISRGKCSRNPGDLFLGSNLDEVLARWRRDYDYVVIDSSPLFAADDASCLAPKVDGTLFVVRSNHSSARAVREALELLAQRQAKVIGVIFNGVNTSARSYHYYKYADYHPSIKA